MQNSSNTVDQLLSTIAPDNSGVSSRLVPVQTGALNMQDLLLALLAGKTVSVTIPSVNEALRMGPQMLNHLNVLKTRHKKTYNALMDSEMEGRVIRFEVKQLEGLLSGKAAIIWTTELPMERLSFTDFTILDN